MMFSQVLFAVLTLLAAVGSFANAGEEEGGFGGLVADKRRALIAFYFPKGDDTAEHSYDSGFFISKHGLALCHHAVLCRKSKSARIVTAGGESPVRPLRYEPIRRERKLKEAELAKEILEKVETLSAPMEDAGKETGE